MLFLSRILKKKTKQNKKQNKTNSAVSLHVVLDFIT